jgi:signal transduction histidine kinase
MIKTGKFKIKTKLVLIQIITSSIVLLLISGLFIYSEIQLIRSYKTSNLVSITKATGMNCASGILFNDQKSVDGTLNYFKIQPDIVNASIMDSIGNPFASYSKKGEEPFTFSNIPKKEATIIQGDYLFIYVPIIQQNEKIGTICVRSELLQLDKIVYSTIVNSIFILIIGFAIALLIALRLQKSISGPILELSSTMSHIITSSDYSIRVPKLLEGKDEIGVLSATSNTLLDTIEESQKTLQQKVKDLDEFSYIASHDLKAPLRGISIMSGFLLKDYQDKLGPEGKEQLTLLSAQVLKMNNLIDGILQYSREGRKNDKKSSVDINALIQEIIILLSPPSNVKIIIENKLPILIGNSTSIQQVFQNLISNAIKYSDKPQVEIKIGCKKIDSRLWQFYVSDNGQGIEEKYFTKIFQLFQTLQSNNSGENTGVGLSIVKKIIENYGGEVWVESKIDEGTTFYFTWSTYAAG